MEDNMSNFFTQVLQWFMNYLRAKNNAQVIENERTEKEIENVKAADNATSVQSSYRPQSGRVQSDLRSGKF